VIHALAGEQDCGGWAAEARSADHLLDLPHRRARDRRRAGLAGFFSKDEILYRTFESGRLLLWVVGLLTSLLTAIYMFRLVFLAFHGPAFGVGPRRARALTDPRRRMATTITSTTRRRPWRSR
jgi:NADH-quinone oxidoreductase subunit L